MMIYHIFFAFLRLSWVCRLFLFLLWVRWRWKWAAGREIYALMASERWENVEQTSWIIATFAASFSLSSENWELWLLCGNINVKRAICYRRKVAKGKRISTWIINHNGKWALYSKLHPPPPSRVLCCMPKLSKQAHFGAPHNMMMRRYQVNILDSHLFCSHIFISFVSILRAIAASSHCRLRKQSSITVNSL